MTVATRKRGRKPREATYFSQWPDDDNRRTPPRQAEFRYTLTGQRYVLRAPVAAAEAAMVARARVHAKSGI